MNCTTAIDFGAEKCNYAVCTFSARHPDLGAASARGIPGSIPTWQGLTDTCTRLTHVPRVSANPLPPAALQPRSAFFFGDSYSDDRRRWRRRMFGYRFDKAPSILQSTGERAAASDCKMKSPRVSAPIHKPIWVFRSLFLKHVFPPPCLPSVRAKVRGHQMLACASVPWAQR